MQELQQPKPQQEQDAGNAAANEHDESDASKASAMSGAIVQKKAVGDGAEVGDGADAGADVDAAKEGVSGSGGALPHGGAIQQSFGSHDVSGVNAHVGGGAGKQADAMGAKAYAVGNDVAFNGSPDLHTAAHEAAHVVQQRGGVSKKLAVGGADDAHEQEADAVADAVVAGKSAQPILDHAAKGSGGDHQAVQQKGNGKKKPAPAPPPAEDLTDKAHTIESIYAAAYTDCDAHGQEWVGAADQAGLCYYNAFTTHEGVRKQQEAADQLKADLLFAVLSIAAGGVLGGLMKTTMVKNVLQGRPEWLVDGIGGVLQGAGGELLGSGITEGVKPKVEIPQVAANPLQYHLDLKNALNIHLTFSKKSLNTHVQSIKDMIVTKNFAGIKNVDVGVLNAKMNEWKSQKVLFRSPQAIPSDALTKELETGMWAKWATTLKNRVRRFTEYGSYEQDVYTSPGGIVEKHLSRLTGQSWDSGWWTSDAEVNKLVSWGGTFKPRTFDLG